MKLNCIHLAIEVACDQLQGFTKDEIAERNGISLPSVGRILARPDYKKLRSECQKVMLETIAEARAKQALNRDWSGASDD